MGRVLFIVFRVPVLQTTNRKLLKAFKGSLSGPLIAPRTLTVVPAVLVRHRPAKWVLIPKLPAALLAMLAAVAPRDIMLETLKQLLTLALAIIMQKVRTVPLQSILVRGAVGLILITWQQQTLDPLKPLAPTPVAKLVPPMALLMEIDRALSIL